jgi:cytochrome c
MDFTTTTGDPLPGPFAGASMNCRSCHLVDERKEFRVAVTVPTPTLPAQPVPRARNQN